MMTDVGNFCCVFMLDFALCPSYRKRVGSHVQLLGVLGCHSLHMRHNVILISKRLSSARGITSLIHMLPILIIGTLVSAF